MTIHIERPSLTAPPEDWAAYYGARALDAAANGDEGLARTYGRWAASELHFRGLLDPYRVEVEHVEQEAANG